MNKIVAVAAATAVPVVSPSLVISEPAAPDDSKLLELVEQYVLAERRYGDAVFARDEMETRRPPPTEVLRIRPRDLELARKPWKAGDEFWTRPCDIGQWRQLIEYRTEMDETEERVVLTTLKVQPSEELRARGDEICTAWDARNNHPKPRGYEKAVREARRAEREFYRLEHEIAETPAQTIEGMLAKIRCAHVWQDEKRELDSIPDGSCEEAMALSIFKDIRRLAAQRTA
jgi:hypothetical protein